MQKICQRNISLKKKNYFFFLKKKKKKREENMDEEFSPDVLAEETQYDKLYEMMDDDLSVTDDEDIDTSPPQKLHANSLYCFCAQQTKRIVDNAGNVIYTCNVNGCRFQLVIPLRASIFVDNVNKIELPKKKVLPDPMFDQDTPGFPDARQHGHVNGKYIKLVAIDGKTTVAMEYPVTVDELELAFSLNTSLMSSSSAFSIQGRQLKGEDDWYDHRSVRVRVVNDKNELVDYIMKRFTGTLVGKIMTNTHWEEFTNYMQITDGRSIDQIVGALTKAYHKEPGFIGLENIFEGQTSKAKQQMFVNSPLRNTSFNSCKMVYQLLKLLSEEQSFAGSNIGYMKLGSLKEDDITLDFLKVLPYMTNNKNLNVAAEDAGLFLHPQYPFIASSPDKLLTVMHPSNTPVFPFERPMSRSTNPMSNTVNLKSTRYYVEYKTLAAQYNAIPHKQMAEKDCKWFGNEFYRIKNTMRDGDYVPVLPEPLVQRFPTGNWKRVNGEGEFVSYNMPPDYYIQMLCNMNIIPGIESGLMVQYAEHAFRVIGVRNDTEYWEKTIIPRLCFVFKRIYLPFVAYTINKLFERKK